VFPCEPMYSDFDATVQVLFLDMLFDYLCILLVSINTLMFHYYHNQRSALEGSY
jgi:hypothetical protein